MKRIVRAFGEKKKGAICKALTIFRSFAASFDFLQVLFQHCAHCTLPLQLVMYYGGAASENERARKRRNKNKYN